MKSVQLKAYQRNVLRALLSLEIVEKEIPAIEHDDDVLVKMYAASCNPSDIAFIQGGYNIVKTLPAVPGFEGSGKIVEAGRNARHLIGKNVSCFIQKDVDGTWAEHFRLSKNDILLLNEEMDMDQAACFTVNPFTAYALVEMAVKNQSRAIIQNAAGGQVASLVRQLARLKQLKTINIVRKEDTRIKLEHEGVKHVLYEQDADFEKKLEQMAQQMKATTAFDAVAGPASGLIFKALPKVSQLIVYGGLSNKPVSEINPMGLIFQGKRILGFNLVDWKNNTEPARFTQIATELEQLFSEGKLETTIQGTVKIDDVVGGLKRYLGNMSEGKILIKP